MYVRMRREERKNARGIKTEGGQVGETAFSDSWTEKEIGNDACFRKL